MYNKVNLDYSSLEPYIGDETLEIHYNRLYMNYLNKLNELLGKVNYDYADTILELAQDISKVPLELRGEILYNLGGTINHALYFYGMSKEGNVVPSGELSKKINDDYGSYDKFMEEFKKMARSLKGSGYTFLVLDKNKNLKIVNMANQDTPYYYGFIPIMAIDLWEHAYYLDYKNDRNKYIDNFFKIVDYKKINELYKLYKK